MLPKAKQDEDLQVEKRTASRRVATDTIVESQKAVKYDLIEVQGQYKLSMLNQKPNIEKISDLNGTLVDKLDQFLIRCRDDVNYSNSKPVSVPLELDGPIGVFAGAVTNMMYQEFQKGEYYLENVSTQYIVSGGGLIGRESESKWSVESAKKEIEKGWALDRVITTFQTTDSYITGTIEIKPKGGFNYDNQTNQKNTTVTVDLQPNFEGSEHMIEYEALSRLGKYLFSDIKGMLPLLKSTNGVQEVLPVDSKKA